MIYPQRNYLQQQNNITWVQGIEGAKAFQLMPNSNAILMDSENENTFYIKVSDNVGMCNLRIFNYTEVTNTPKQDVDLSQFVTRAELQEIIGGITNEQSVSTAKSTRSKSSKTITE